jgi:hypothetical protein
MPIPSRAIEVGSGTAVGTKLKLTADGVPVIEPGLIMPLRKTPVVSTVNVSDPLSVAGVYVKITSFGGGGAIVAELGVGAPLKLSIAVTGPEKKKSNSPAVAPGTEKVPVTVIEPARDGAASATLASKPTANAQSDERFIIENSWEDSWSQKSSNYLCVLLIHNAIVSIPARPDLTNHGSSAIELVHRSD